MERTKEGLTLAIEKIRELKADFWKNVKVLGTNESLNQSLERAGRVADFFELGELMCIDALNRRESCGGHFRPSRRLLTVRRSASTPSSPTSPPGSGAARTVIPPSCTRSTQL